MDLNQLDFLDDDKKNFYSKSINDIWEIIDIFDDDNKNLITKNIDNIWKFVDHRLLYNLLKIGLTPDLCDINGNTLLHSSIKFLNFNAIKVLLEFKASINYLNNSKRSPIENIDKKKIQDYLCYTCLNGNKEILKIILKLGIPFNVYNTKYKSYPYVILKKNKNFEMMDILKEVYIKSPEFLLLCPSWNFKDYYKGEYKNQKKLFQDNNNKVIRCYWSKYGKWLKIKHKKKNF